MLGACDHGAASEALTCWSAGTRLYLFLEPVECVPAATWCADSTSSGALRAGGKTRLLRAWRSRSHASRDPGADVEAVQADYYNHYRPHGTLAGQTRTNNCWQRQEAERLRCPENLQCTTSGRTSSTSLGIDIRHGQRRKYSPSWSSTAAVKSACKAQGIPGAGLWWRPTSL